MKIPTIATLLVCALMQCAAAAGASGAADAERQDSPLSIQLSVKKIVHIKNEERKVDASRAEPGDILEYRAVYKNIGRSGLNALSAILPLPEHTTLVGGSPYPGNPEVSTRSAKEKFLPLPISDSTSKASSEAVSSKDGSPGFGRYGALRWEISQLAPGESFTVGARVRVNKFISNDTSKASSAVQSGASILQ